MGKEEEEKRNRRKGGTEEEEKRNRRKGGTEEEEKRKRLTNVYLKYNQNYMNEYLNEKFNA